MKYIIRPAPVVDEVEADEEDALADSENFHCQFPYSKPKPTSPLLLNASSPILKIRSSFHVPHTLGSISKPPPQI